MGSLARSYISHGSLWFGWVHSCANKCRLVHSGSHAFTQEGLGVVGLIGVGLVHSGARRCRRVHSGSRNFTRTRILVPIGSRGGGA